MEHGSETSKLALNWLLGAGLVAIAFSLFLVWSDSYLSNSTAEHENAAAMSEVRRAQHSLSAHSVDNRQIVGVSQKAEAADNH